MAKFNVGDKIKDRKALYKGEARIVDIVDGGDYGEYIVKYQGGNKHSIDFKDAIAANACSCNAKLKEGDMVKIVQGALRGKMGKIRRIEMDGLGEYYIVTTDDGYEEEMSPGNVVSANACTNAKFKVGDIVVDRGFPGIKLKIVQVDSRFDPNADTYAVKPLRGGAVTSSHEKDLTLANSAASANQTVANAINAMSRK